MSLPRAQTGRLLLTLATATLAIPVLFLTAPVAPASSPSAATKPTAAPPTTPADPANTADTWI